MNDLFFFAFLSYAVWLGCIYMIAKCEPLGFPSLKCYHLQQCEYYNLLICVGFHSRKIIIVYILCILSKVAWGIYNKHRGFVKLWAVFVNNSAITFTFIEKTVIKHVPYYGYMHKLVTVNHGSVRLTAVSWGMEDPRDMSDLLLKCICESHENLYFFSG